MLANDEELLSPLFLKNFNRLFEHDSFQLHEAVNAPAVQSIRKYEGRDILFKQHAKLFYKSQSISYDGYRMKNLTVDMSPYRFLDKCSIFIHESDFIDFQLNILNELSACYRAGFPLAVETSIQQYRITNAEVDKFDNYMKEMILPNLHIKTLDTRLDFNEVMFKHI